MSGAAAVPHPDAAREILLALLSARAAHATVCPSEVARMLASACGASTEGAWREAMPCVHAAVDRLAREGRVRLSWKGVTMAGRSGPYRIGRKPA